MQEYDIVIVGAGPAGATLARLTGRDHRVLLLDRRNLEAPWQAGMSGKCCGGLLAPDAQKELARFRLSLPESVIGGPQLFAVRSIDLGCGLERCYQRFYLNLDREAFDRWLAGLAQGIADCRFQARFLDFRDGVVQYRHHERVESVRCRYLVAADGAASAIRRQYQPNLLLDRDNDYYIAIQELVAPEEESPFFSALFQPGLTDFYGWTIPKRDGLLIGLALNPGLEALRRFELLKWQLRDYGMRFGAAIRREGAFVLRPRHRGSFWLGESNVFAVGEAAGWISPSSAEGFSYAFASAGILAEVFRAHSAPGVAEYRRACRGLYWNWYGKMLKLPLMYRPGWRRGIMRSGVTAIDPYAAGGE